MVLFCQISTNYFQAIGRRKFVNFLSLLDGFFSVVIPSAILAPSMGAMGVWIAMPAALIITAVMSPIYSIICNKKMPHGIREWLLFPQGFPENEHYARFAFSLHEPDDVAKVAAAVQEFCEKYELDEKTSFHASLCFEEMAWNVFQHGFRADKKPHTIDLTMVVEKEGALLRIKDDCIPFDPVEFAEMTAEEKNGISHRGNALKALEEKLGNI